MQTIHETATITAKGQITLPKAIRQALGVDYGGKVAFDLQNGRVVVSRDEVIHTDPAISGFLGMFERDIQSGRHTGALPEGLASAMARSLSEPTPMDDDILGDVDLCPSAMAGRCCSMPA